MYNRYKNKEKRKLYLREWRKKNRERLNKYLSDYLKRTGNKYTYKPKGELGEKYYGTCGIGRKYEKIALKLLRGSIDCNSMSFAGKWDIEWNGLKVDVKMRNLNKRGYWGFTTKKEPKADYFLCFCVDNEKIEKVYFIPAEVFKTSFPIFKNNNKYNKYLLVFSKANVNQRK